MNKPEQQQQPQAPQQKTVPPVATRPAPMPPGYYSNQRIIARRGVAPQFIEDFGGCSANYR